MFMFAQNLLARSIPFKTNAMKSIIPFFALLIALAFSTKTFGQTDESLLAQLLEEEHNSVEALALYPAATRLDILEAAKYPEALVKLESLQSKSSDAFKMRMENSPKETQKAIWDLTRYPGLVARLVEADGASAAVLADYPTEIHQRAKTVAAANMPLLVEVDRMNKYWDIAFNGLLEDYPPIEQDALRRLVELPEVLTILTDDLRLTVLVGDLYSKNPQWLLQQMDSLNLAVARERAKEVEEWKSSLESNPQAKEELAQSAQAFAGEYSYDDVYYDYDNNNYDEQEPAVVQHYYHHYPYWFGYPYWYAYPRWRPYPYWYDWGFYWGAGNVIIVIDMPSYYFTNWFFYNPWHYNYYSHLSCHFTNHYYGHRHSGSSVTAGVDRWRARNREVVTDEWLDNARNRPESFKELGKFETERQKYNQTHANKPVSQTEFLEKNSRKYPDIAKPVERRQEQEQVDRQRPANERPRKELPPVVKPKTQVPTPRKPEVKPPTMRKDNAPDIPKVDKARERHENIWDKSKRETVQPRPAPRKPSVQPPKNRTVKPAPTPKVNKSKGGGGK